MDIDKETGWLVAAMAAVFGGGGVWGWLTERRKAKAQEPMDLAGQLTAFSKSLNEDARSIIKGLQEQNGALLHRCAAYDGRITALEQENQACRGENAQMAQRIGSLEDYFRRHDLDIPISGLAGKFVVLDGEKTTVFPDGPKETP